MDKLTYLVRTLSRTRRKDYENYVVNAVWNRLGDSEVQPVTQQLVVMSPKNRRFIDLYFPQINVGVECNEAFHRGTKDQDEARTIDIFDVLRQVRADASDYRQLNVDVVDPVTGAYRSLEELDTEIDQVVRQIRDAVQERRDAGTFEVWNIGADDPVAAVQSLDRLSVADDISFRTQYEACNSLFGDDYRVLRRSCFTTRSMRRVYGDEFSVWFGKAELDGKAVRGGWHDVLSEDGQTIGEYNDDYDAVDPGADEKRIVFIHTRDSITREWRYRFVGVFERQGVSVVNGNRAKHFVRIADSFPVIRREDTAT